MFIYSLRTQTLAFDSPWYLSQGLAQNNPVNIFWKNIYLFLIEYWKMCQFVPKRIVQAQGHPCKYPGMPGHSPLCTTCFHTPHLSLFSTGRLRIREKHFPSIMPVLREHSCHPKQHCVAFTASQVMRLSDPVIEGMWQGTGKWFCWLSHPRSFPPELCAPWVKDFLFLFGLIVKNSTISGSLIFWTLKFLYNFNLTEKLSSSIKKFHIPVTQIH